MKYYYLLNGKIMSANEKMPELRIVQHKDYNQKFEDSKFKMFYNNWLNSLQPCEISESELCLILSNVTKLDYDNPIEVTDIVNASVICKVERCDGECIECNHMAIRIVFKNPKQVEEIEAVDMLLNTFGQYCTLNGIKLTDSNKVGQAVIDFLKSDIYEIFKNQK